MPDFHALNNPNPFTITLFEKMKSINLGIEDLELYEFQYGLDNLTPESGEWESIKLPRKEEIETLVNQEDFYAGIQLKPCSGDRIVLDEKITWLARVLLAGLAKGSYSEAWIRKHFYFDIRGFYFLHRTMYFTDPILEHFGWEPLFRFEQKQKKFERFQDIGYKAFKEANANVDQTFIEMVLKLVSTKGTPMILAIAGPTAAGKTEIVSRLRGALEQANTKVTSIEMDNFLTDRDYREAKGIHTLGKEAIHLELFKHSLEQICLGHTIRIPRYDFLLATSSHDLDGNLKAGGVAIEIEPADIIFIEGNFPFLLKEVVDLIDIKVVYLTDDPIRLKRKWKRDIDYRKKYEPTYFRNRFFKDQFLMAQKSYRPQMEVCDILVDTSGAAIWAVPEVITIIKDDGIVER